MNVKNLLQKSAFTKSVFIYWFFKYALIKCDLENVLLKWVSKKLNDLVKNALFENVL